MAHWVSAIGRGVWKFTKALVLFVSSLAALIALGAVSARTVLSIEQPPTHADVIVVLGGGFADRAALAAELFHAGWAPRILISGFGDNAENRHFLVNHGVPGNLIDSEDASTS